MQSVPEASARLLAISSVYTRNLIWPSGLLLCSFLCPASAGWDVRKQPTEVIQCHAASMQATWGA